jgi:hypothetical protein
MVSEMTADLRMSLRQVLGRLGIGADQEWGRAQLRRTDAGTIQYRYDLAGGDQRPPLVRHGETPIDWTWQDTRTDRTIELIGPLVGDTEFDQRPGYFWMFSLEYSDDTRERIGIRVLRAAVIKEGRLPRAVTEWRPGLAEDEVEAYIANADHKGVTQEQIVSAWGDFKLLRQLRDSTAHRPKGTGKVHTLTAHEVLTAYAGCLDDDIDDPQKRDVCDRIGWIKEHTLERWMGKERRLWPPSRWPEWPDYRPF